jgi:F-type H+-transporting ATPase subunit a
MEPQLQWHVAGYIVNADTMIFSWASMIIVFVLFRLAARKASVEKPRGLQNFIELVLDFVHGYVRDQLNEEQGNRLFRLLVAELMFLLTINIFSLLPFPFFHAPAADINTTLGMALIVFVLIHYYGFRYKRVGHLKSMAKPWGLAPFLVLEQFTNPITLAMRLFGNILAGDLLMSISASVIPNIAALSLAYGFAFVASVVLQIAVLGFNSFIAVMQSFIFMVLTLSYISHSMTTAEDH